MQIDVVDIWTHYTPYPFNQLPKSYSFMVKHGFLWRFGFNTTQVPASTAAMALLAESPHPEVYPGLQGVEH
jgi:hypothetical protein